MGFFQQEVFYAPLPLPCLSSIISHPFLFISLIQILQPPFIFSQHVLYFVHQVNQLALGLVHNQSLTESADGLGHYVTAGLTQPQS